MYTFVIRSNDLFFQRRGNVFCDLNLRFYRIGLEDGPPAEGDLAAPVDPEAAPPSAESEPPAVVVTEEGTPTETTDLTTENPVETVPTAEEPKPTETATEEPKPAEIVAEEPKPSEGDAAAAPPAEAEGTIAPAESAPEETASGKSCTGMRCDRDTWLKIQKHTHNFRKLIVNT